MITLPFNMYVYALIAVNTLHTARDHLCVALAGKIPLK